MRHSLVEDVFAMANRKSSQVAAVAWRWRRNNGKFNYSKLPITSATIKRLR